MKILFIGLSITSSWGNGHATTYRALVRELVRRGHRVSFLERDVPWYADNRDLQPEDSPAEVILYDSLSGLAEHAALVRGADAVIVGSYVPDGAEVCEWVLRNAGGVTAFYDIDTPVTLALLEDEACDYLYSESICRFDVYLSFAGGRTLSMLEDRYGCRCARALYCSVDVSQYFPEKRPFKWDMGYLGTYSADRQPGLERLLARPAETWNHGRFVVAGPQYPAGVAWSRNVGRIEHLPPAEHREFYNSQRFTLNITRADMIAAGHSPSVRLFEAAACGTPIISDWWEGLDEFFEPGKEILVAREPEEVLSFLRELGQDEAAAIGKAGRRKVLNSHTAAHRAAELESHLVEVYQGIVGSAP
jgi:spore maturation protein CgeB